MVAKSNQLYRVFLKFAHAVFICFCFVFRPKTHGVLVAVWLEERILIVKNSYYAKYSLPGGFVRPGEQLRSAAARELREEVGIALAPDRLRLASRARFRIFFRRESLSYFEIRLTHRPTVSIDDREVVWAEFMKPENALKMNLTLPARTYFTLVWNDRISSNCRTAGKARESRLDAS